MKKAYAKIKHREPRTTSTTARGDGEAVGEHDGHGAEKEDAHETMHPTRGLMIKDEDVAQASAAARKGSDDQQEESGAAETTTDAAASSSDGHRRRTRRPGYYDKQLARADQLREEREGRQREREERMAQRAEKMAQRDKFKRAMAKTVGRDGKKKLGRESGLLLDKVKRMMAEKK